MTDVSGGLAARPAPNFHFFLLCRDVCKVICIGKLAGWKGSQHGRSVHSGVSLALTVRWRLFFLIARRGVVAFDMRMARMGVSLDFDLLTWGQQIPLFTSWEELIDDVSKAPDLCSPVYSAIDYVLYRVTLKSHPNFLTL